MKYRSRFDIVGAMLLAAVGGATKTRMMYEAFLSHTQVDEYIGFLLGKRLLSLAQDKKHYLPTEKGLRFLEMFAEIKDVVTVENGKDTPQKEAGPGDVGDLNTLTPTSLQGRERKP
jgi:predicted transcriptional regulator